jgi:hypothetical protein
MLALMRQPLNGRSAEYADNRISHFAAQWGKCAVTGREFQTVAEIHCHHKVPRQYGGNDKYDNLVLEPVHKLIHAVQTEIIAKYLSVLNLNKEQIGNLNKLREQSKLFSVT